MNLADSIVKTLTYHDIFEYPLTLNEIHKFLIGEKANLKQVELTVSDLKSAKQIRERKGFFYLKNREKIVPTRLNHKKYSRVKQKKALFYSNILKLIPTLNLVAVSGALSMENSHKKDDIDLVLISAPKTMWTTRFLANLLLLPFKRNFAGTNISDRACLNLFIDGQDLKIHSQNLYTAHEICQMKLIWDRNNAYRHFLKANSWVKKFLPNWQPEKVESGKWEVESVGNPKKNLSLIEILFKRFQLWYMRKKISTERIGQTQLFFHPANTQNYVMREYQKRLKKLKLSV